VLLSAATPTRLLSAFPEGTPVSRVGIEEAVERVKSSIRPRLPADRVTTVSKTQA
jgi:ATP-dependent DNA helicase DinG